MARNRPADSGLIPAGAGQTNVRRSRFSTAWAHPRRCGADDNPDLKHHRFQGSSPQVRGRLEHGTVSVGAVGLIPAGAGQTAPRRVELRCRTAHPRRCGADSMSNAMWGLDAGSSPQVRGRRRTTSHPATGNGLIPAGAGQTTGPYPTTRSSRAHPRRCGADQQRFIQANPRRGSSPQVRGRRVAFFLPHLAGRLIPAGAGQTGL